MSTLASHQTLAAGKPVSQRWTSLGGVSGALQTVRPGKAKALIVSRPGEGKSAILQSNPDAFIFNFDITSPTCPNCPATIWPYASPETGQAMGDDGKPFVLTWEGVEAKLKLLFELAKSGSPRPETVVFDSLMSMQALIKDWVCRKAAKEWKQLHGPSAWDDVYETITGTMLALSQHGYGVIFTCHWMNAKIPTGDDRFVIQPELVIGPSLYKRLFGYFEWVAEVKKQESTEQVPDPRFPDLKNKMIARPVTRAFLSVNDPALKDILKYRVNITEPIEVPLGRGWAAFEKAYLDAAARGPLSPPVEVKS